MIARALLLAAGAASVSAQSCFPEYQCIFHWMSSNPSTSAEAKAHQSQESGSGSGSESTGLVSGLYKWATGGVGASSAVQEYSWDFRPLCGQDRNWTITTAQGYVWSIIYTVCGNTSYRCNPRWSHVSAGGVVHQTWGQHPDECIATDPETGKVVPCTQDCEVLGHTRPEFDLVDESNPATGGVILRHSGLVPTSRDPNGCATNPLTGYPRERSMDMILQCDQSMSRNAIRPVSFVEPVPGNCYYQFTLATGAACGLAGDPFDVLPPANNSGSNFGFVVLGAVLTFGLQFATAWAASRGYLARVPGASFLSSLTKYLPSSSGSSGSSTKMSAGTTAVAPSTPSSSSSGGGYQSSGGYSSL